MKNITVTYNDGLYVEYEGRKIFIPHKKMQGVRGKFHASENFFTKTRNTETVTVLETLPEISNEFDVKFKEISGNKMMMKKEEKHFVTEDFGDILSAITEVVIA